jgi:hypothetical protein
MFLDKVSRRKLALLRYLEDRTLFTVSKDQAVNDLTLSDFLLGKIIDELNADFVNYELNEGTSIIYDKNDIKLLENRNALSKDVEAIYIKNSIQFLLLEQFFWESCESITAFAREQFISHTLAYKEFRKLKQTLSALEIEISKDFKLIGNENSIRNFIGFLWLKVHKRDTDIYPEYLVSDIKRQILAFEAVFVISEISEYTRSKLTHFLAINLIRMERKHLLTKMPHYRQIYFIPVLKLYLKKISKVLSEFSKTEDDSSIVFEARRIVLFFIAEDMVAISPENLVESIKPLQTLNQKFKADLKRAFPTANLDEKKFEKRLTLIHFKCIFSQIEVLNKLNTIDMTYFLETYQEYFVFCKKYIKQNIGNQWISSCLEYLFLEYLLLLINCLSLKDIIAPINICIDFSMGKEYNEMIRKKIEKISVFNLRFQVRSSRNVDLFLTDIRNKKLTKCVCVIWTVPTRSIDWMNLVEELLKVRAEKMKNK